MFWGASDRSRRVEKHSLLLVLLLQVGLSLPQVRFGRQSDTGLHTYCICKMCRVDPLGVL